ncbi:hypothetical protein BGZ60DRAFT_553976 [Tricladium varicosporioides]|nr:hypothetical protein BGZ60DRAFT_553976 [Hymenoscyphus varicosporioides]
MASLLRLLNGTVDLIFDDFSITGSWTYLEGQKVAFDVIELQTQCISKDLLSRIQKQKPRSCRFRGSQEGTTEDISFQACSNLPQWAIWWLEGLSVSAFPESTSKTAFTLLLPTTEGFILRSDIFETRLKTSVRVQKIWSHCEIYDRFHGITSPTLGLLTKLEPLLARSVCGVLFEPGPGGEVGNNCDVLLDRLSLPLFMKTQLERKRIAIVDGGFNLEFQRDLFTAVTGLGVDIVVLDRQGHWLQKMDSHHLIEEFLPVDLRIDDGLPERLVAAVRASEHQIHGITTMSDSYLCPTAVAAEMLGLPTSPADSFRVCVDKHSTRKLIPLPHVQYPSVPDNGSEDIDAAKSPNYPVILKPSQGGGSLGVFLVKSSAEQSEATEKIQKLGKDVTIEPYIDGPEVDVNIVIQDGQVSFWEVSDNLPSTAEGFPTQFSAKSWTETGNIFPSSLSQDEINSLKEYSTACILKLGFRWGVFHCEARVHNSSSKYQFSEDGWPHLISHKKSDETREEIAMIEINARPPGFTSSAGSACAYGVDYCALQLMAAIRDNDRFQALSVPYSQSPSGWWECAFVPVEKGGVFRPSIMFAELLVTSPKLMKHVYHWITFFQDGDTIQDPNVTGKTFWAAWFVVFSTQSREHLDNTVAALRSSLKFSVI